MKRLVWTAVCLALLVLENSTAFAQSGGATFDSETDRYNALDSALKSAKVRQAELTSEIPTIQEKIRELEDQVRLAQSQAGQDQRKIQSLQQSLSGQRQQLANVQSRRAQTRRQIQSLQNQIGTIELILQHSWIDRLPANFGLNGFINYPIDGNLDLGFGAAATFDFNITDVISIGGKFGYTRVAHKDGLITLAAVPITATMTIAGSAMTAAVSRLVLSPARVPTNQSVVKGGREWWCTAEAGVMLIQNVGDGPSTENGLLIGASCGIDFSVTKHITVSPCLGGYVTTAEGAGGNPHSLTLSCSVRFEPCQR